MRTTHMLRNRGLVRMAATALSLALALTVLAPAASAQQSDQARRSMGLTYDSLDAILRDLQDYKFDRGVGAPLALRSWVFGHKDDPASRKDCEARLLAFVNGLGVLFYLVCWVVMPRRDAALAHLRGPGR